MNDFIAKIAPTLASALLGPLGGVAVAGLGKILGIDAPTAERVGKIINEGRITSEQLAEIQKLELTLKAEELERGFKYSELEFKDRDSARTANVGGGTQRMLFWMSLLLLSVCFGAEIRVLFWGYPKDIVDAILVGRILGLLDSVAMQVMAYWYGTTSGSQRTRDLLANKS